MLAQKLEVREKLDPKKPYSARRKSEVVIPKGCLHCSGRPLAGLTEGLKNMYAEVRFAKSVEGSVIQEALREIGKDYQLGSVLEPIIGQGHSLKISCPRDAPDKYKQGYNILGYISPYSNRNVMVIGPDKHPVSGGWSYTQISVLHKPWPELNPRVSYSTFGVDNYLAGTILTISDEIARRADCKMDGR